MHNIVFCVNDKYAYMVPTVMESVLLNTANPCRFFVVNSSISDDIKDIILKTASSFGSDHQVEFINFDAGAAFAQRTSDTIFIQSFRNGYDAYSRIFLYEILKPYGVSKCLYLDVDLVVNRSIEPLLAMLDETEYATGVRDIVYYEDHTEQDNPTFVNSGVLLLNLDNLRKIDFIGLCIDYLKDHHDFDQVVINAVLSCGKINLAPRQFNEQSPNKSLVAEAAIIHYTGPYKPWMIQTRWRAKKFYWHKYVYSNSRRLKGDPISREALDKKFNFYMKFRGLLNLWLSVRVKLLGQKSEVVFTKPGADI